MDQYPNDKPPAYDRYNPDSSFAGQSTKTLSLYHLGKSMRSSLVTTTPAGASPFSPNNPREENTPLYYSDVSEFSRGQPDVTLHVGGDNRGRVAAIARCLHFSTTIKLGILGESNPIYGKTNYKTLETHPDIWWEDLRPPSLRKKLSIWRGGGCLVSGGRGELEVHVPAGMLRGELSSRGAGGQPVRFVWRRTHHDRLGAEAVGGTEGGAADRAEGNGVGGPDGGESTDSGKSAETIPYGSLKLILADPARDPNDQAPDAKIKDDKEKDTAKDKNKTKDEDDQIVVAQFINRKCFSMSWHTMGRLVLQTRLASGPEWESIVLVSLFAILEKERREAAAAAGAAGAS